eukprot:3677628-Rhodomonas_salina.1
MQLTQHTCVNLDDHQQHPRDRDLTCPRNAGRLEEEEIHRLLHMLGLKVSRQVRMRLQPPACASAQRLRHPACDWCMVRESPACLVASEEDKRALDPDRGDGGGRKRARSSSASTRRTRGTSRTQVRHQPARAVLQSCCPALTSIGVLRPEFMDRLMKWKVTKKDISNRILRTGSKAH